MAEDATLQVLEARGKKAKKAVWVAGAAGATIGLLFGGPVGAALGMQLGAAVTGSAAVGAVLGAGVSAVTSGVTGGAIGGTLILFTCCNTPLFTSILRNACNSTM